MRILVVVAHYFGPAPSEYQSKPPGSGIDLLGRLAAVNDMIVALQGQFGANRYIFDGKAISPKGTRGSVDIVMLAKRDCSILPLLGLDPGTFETVFVDDKPTSIPFHAHSLLRDRLGAYDFYCFMEDDLIIRDPAFFEKLLWFQRSFGPKTLLAPVRCEWSSTGTPAKWIIDCRLRDHCLAPFRRPHQAPTLEGVWNGGCQTFHLPDNPHSACFFLTEEQMTYWAKQPTFDDHDDTWAGPIESAGTLSIGKVFDIYKPAQPDPFFLEIQHAGVRHSSVYWKLGLRLGEPPLLALAQNALAAAVDARRGYVDTAAPAVGDCDASFEQLIARLVAQGTAVEHKVKNEISDRRRPAVRFRQFLQRLRQGRI